MQIINEEKTPICKIPKKYLYALYCFHTHVLFPLA